jgi:sn-glycerol 3-phosphate transport system permease protein
MEKSAFFGNKALPYALLLPQLVITLVFFYWPASQAVWQSFLREDAFGLNSDFVGLENYQALFAQPEYYKSMLTTLVFSSLVAALSLAIALLFATQADKNIKAAPVFKVMMIWPYAVAPAVAGVLWLFMFHPTLGTLARPMRVLGMNWNPLLNGNHAMTLIVMAAVWKQIAYNFLFFLAGLQSIPRSVLEAGAGEDCGPEVVEHMSMCVEPLPWSQPDLPDPDSFVLAQEPRSHVAVHGVQLELRAEIVRPSVVAVGHQDPCERGVGQVMSAH